MARVTSRWRNMQGARGIGLFDRAHNREFVPSEPMAPAFGVKPDDGIPSLVEPPGCPAVLIPALGTGARQVASGIKELELGVIPQVVAAKADDLRARESIQDQLKRGPERGNVGRWS